MIGDATVVALGEGDHFAAEPMLFRNRVLQYLVQKKGFTAIAIESGIVESRLVHDFVRTGSGHISDVVAQGITWTFDQLPQNEALVRWLRDYNTGPRHERKVNFYGFDVPGSPSNPNVRRGVGTALQEVLKFLERADRESAAAFHPRLDSFLPNLHFDLYSPPTGPGYHRLTQAQRDQLTATIADLVALVQAREAGYSAASAPDEYRWAQRAAIGARQVDSWLRQIPLDWQATAEQLRFLDFASDIRDRAQADNLDWIIKQEGPSGKILVYAHNGHLSTTSVTWLWRPADTSRQFRDATGAYSHQVAGTYLKRRLGKRLITIGNLIGKGQIGCADFTHLIEPASLDSVDALAQELGVPLFLLDLRKRPPGVGNLPSEDRQLGRGFEIPGAYKVSLKLPFGEAFDALFFVDTVTPACTTRLPMNGS